MAYTITAVCTSGGSVSGGGTYEQDERFTLTATASTGYAFLKWVRGSNSAHVSFNSTYSKSATQNDTYRAIFVKITAEHGSVSRSNSTYTTDADVGYKFISLSVTSGGDYMTVSGNTLTVKNTAPQGADLVAVASFSKKTASDKYNIYLRWKSVYSVSEGGQEYERTFRVVKGDAAGSKKLRVFKSDATTALSAVAPNSGVAIERGNETSWYRANYFPLADGGDYWVGRNVGAMRSGDEQLVGWELRGKTNGNVLQTFPADGSTTIVQIAAILDAATDTDAPFDNNADGDYRLAILEAVWGNPRTITVSTTGTNDETPTVSATPNPALENDTVTLTAQVDDLSTCEFSEWTVTDGDGDPVQVTEVSDEGVATFTMPDSDVSAVAAYTAKKFSVSVSHGENGNASVLCRATSSASWGVLPQGGVEYGWQVKFTATPSEGYVFDGWYRDGDEAPYSVLSEYVIEFVSDDIALEAQFVYGSTPQKATLTVTSSDKDKGTVDIDGGTDHSAEDDGSEASAGFDIGDDVTLVAAFGSEFEFVGWYAGGKKISGEVIHKFKFGVDADHSLTQYMAEFGVSDDAIYEWEGSDENKEMEWQSKVYTAQKPFDPVAARVDATSYTPPVSLNVGTMSSPDVEPTREHGISVGSQDGRRLPRMRPERFVRFTVKSTHEIDAVVIGTNMAEVN